MESRARKVTGTREAALGLSAAQGGSQRGRKAATGSSKPGSLVARIFMAIVVVGLVTHAYMWVSRSPPPQPNNGWMHHLRQVEPESQAEEFHPVPRQHEEPGIVAATAAEMSREELLKRRQQFDPSTHNADQRQVVEMIKWAWKGYETYAFGHDSLNVKTMTGTGLPDHDMALTLVDSLDTLFIVGLFDEFDRASQWVAKNMEQRIFLNGFISLFETTIRLLGGLLSSYYLSGEDPVAVPAMDIALATADW